MRERGRKIETSKEKRRKVKKIIFLIIIFMFYIISFEKPGGFIKINNLIRRKILQQQ